MFTGEILTFEHTLNLATYTSKSDFIMKEFLILSLSLFLSITAYTQSECIKGDCKNGSGTCVFPSGAKYIGDFKNGKLHGKGIFYFSDGNK